MKRYRKIVYPLSLVLLLCSLGTSVFAITINYSPTRKVIAPQLNTASLPGALSDDFSISTSSAQTTLIAAGSTGTSSTQDLVYENFISGSIEYRCVVNTSGYTTTPTLTSVTPGIATIDQAGIVTYVADGLAQFNARVGSRNKGVACPVRRSVNEASSVFDGFVSTSTAYHIKNAIDTRIEGLTPSSTTLDIYSATNDTTRTYTRNTNLWLDGVDLTAIPAYSTGSGTAANGILIAPDIIVKANHSYTAGVVFFVTNDGTTVSRSIISSTRVGTTDILLQRLDSDVPSSITPAKLLAYNDIHGSSGQVKLTSSAINLDRIPVAFTNQFRTIRIGVFEIWSYQYEIIDTPSEDLSYYDWYSRPVGGDSGHAAFTIVNNQLVALGTWHYADGVPDMSVHIPAINSTITSTGSSHQVSTVDLSGFSSY